MYSAMLSVGNVCTSVTLVKSEFTSASQAKSSTEPNTHKCLKQPLGSGQELLYASWAITLLEGIMQTKLKVQSCCHIPSYYAQHQDLLYMIWQL